MESDKQLTVIHHKREVQLLINGSEQLSVVGIRT